MTSADDRRTIAWLHRRAGFGLTSAELDALTSAGVDAAIAELVDPDASGVAPAPDPWASTTLTLPSRPGADASADARKAYQQTLRAESTAAISAWLDHMASTPRPLESWLTWFWHGVLVSGLDKVRVPRLLVQQLRTYHDLALAPFPQLLRAATVDPAMLLYLDGNESTGDAPNENYGREVMELFALGVGAYTEDDVKAAARALTGWRVAPATGTAAFVGRRHDDAPQTYLGVAGVHDVDTVVSAITANPACGPWVAGKLARAILGPDIDDGYVQQLGRSYAAGGYDTRQLVRTILTDGADGRHTTLAWAPVPWLAAMQRATGATIAPGPRLQQLRAAGQVPMLPPNVAGWPGGRAWFASSTVVARFDLASLLASSAPDAGAALDAVRPPDGFSDATNAAIASRHDDPVGALAIAMSSPDLMVV